MRGTDAWIPKVSLISLLNQDPGISRNIDHGSVSYAF